MIDIPERQKKKNGKKSVGYDKAPPYHFGKTRKSIKICTENTTNIINNKKQAIAGRLSIMTTINFIGFSLLLSSHIFSIKIYPSKIYQNNNRSHCFHLSSDVRRHVTHEWDQGLRCFVPILYELVAYS